MPRAAVVLVLLGTGCEDYIWGEVVVDDNVQESGFAGVQQIVEQNCLGCHQKGTELGGLNLETDLYGATVNVVGQYSIPLVLPGEPENSMLYLKMADEQPDYTGTDMPPGSGGLSRALTGVVFDWIANGAPNGPGTAPADTGQ